MLFGIASVKAITFSHLCVENGFKAEKQAVELIIIVQKCSKGVTLH